MALCHIRWYGNQNAARLSTNGTQPDTSEGGNPDAARLKKVVSVGPTPAMASMQAVAAVRIATSSFRGLEWKSIAMTFL